MQSAVINELEHPAITVSHERGPTDSQLLEETIGQRLRSVTERFGGREAAVVRHQNYRATYDELSGQVELAARALIAAGVSKGGRVGIWAPNRYQWLIVQFAPRVSPRSWSRSTRPARRPNYGMPCTRPA